MLFEAFQSFLRVISGLRRQVPRLVLSSHGAPISAALRAALGGSEHLFWSLELCVSAPVGS